MQKSTPFYTDWLQVHFSCAVHIWDSVGCVHKIGFLISTVSSTHRCSCFLLLTLFSKLIACNYRAVARFIDSVADGTPFEVTHAFGG